MLQGELVTQATEVLCLKTPVACVTSLPSSYNFSGFLLFLLRFLGSRPAAWRTKTARTALAELLELLLLLVGEDLAELAVKLLLQLFQLLPLFAGQPQLVLK